MSRWTTLGLGVLARILSTLACHYAGWLFRRVGDPDDEEFDFWEDLRAFKDWLLQVTAGWFVGRRQDRYEEDYDGWQSHAYR